MSDQSDGIGFEINLRFGFTSIWIIESLQKGDYRGGKEIYDDVLHYRQMIDGDFCANFRTVRSGQELFALLYEIESDLKSTGKIPLIHFDTHGSREGIELNSGDDSDTRELIRYKDLFVPLQRLNILTRNNLFVIVAACEGSYLANVVQPTDPSPFWGILGPTERISAGDLFAAYKVLYESQLSNPDLNLGLTRMRSAVPEYEGRIAFLSSEYMFMVAFRRYIAEFCNSHAARHRVRELLIKKQIKQGCDPIQGAVFAKQWLDHLMSEAGQREQFGRFANRFFLHHFYPDDPNLPRPRFEAAMGLSARR